MSRCEPEMFSFFNYRQLFALYQIQLLEYVLFFQNVWIFKKYLVRMLISGLNLKYSNDLNFYFVCFFLVLCFGLIVLIPH